MHGHMNVKKNGFTMLLKFVSGYRQASHFFISSGSNFSYHHYIQTESGSQKKKLNPAGTRGYSMDSEVRVSNFISTYITGNSFIVHIIW
jgi:hypothetical protein